MTRLLLLGILVFGMAGFAIGQQDGQGQNQGNGVSLPEPSQAISALGLLAGTSLILRGRRKK